MKNIHLGLDTSYSILNIGAFTLKFIKLKMHEFTSRQLLSGCGTRLGSNVDS